MPDQTPVAPLATPSDGPVAGATLVIEAPTAEAALAELHDRLGGEARIVEVRRVARGGLGGFFTREAVELHAAPGVAARPLAPPAEPPDVPLEVDLPSASPIDRLLDVGADGGHEIPETVDFATYLRRQEAPGTPARVDPTTSSHHVLVERAAAAARQAITATEVLTAAGGSDAGGVVDPVSGQVAPTPDRAAPTPDGDATIDEPSAAREPGPAWSVATLVKIGLPAGLVRGLHVTDPSDDIAWTVALATALRPVCRPLPAGRALLVGPRARAVASALGVPTTTVGQPIRSRAATVAAVVGGGAAGHRWLERVRGTRWLHLVVGGSGWRSLLHLDPLAVSWAASEDVPEAVRLAVELGLVLGAGPLSGEVRRARPLDVALAVRALLPVHP